MGTVGLGKLFSRSKKIVWLSKEKRTTARQPITADNNVRESTLVFFNAELRIYKRRNNFDLFTELSLRKKLKKYSIINQNNAGKLLTELKSGENPTLFSTLIKCILCKIY
jgi:hypothetical protein